jgi:hypothetical protein
LKTVGILSNLAEKDGPADHARYLRDELVKYYDVMLTNDWPAMGAWAPTVVIVNWHEGWGTPTTDDVENLKRRGAKVIAIFHNTRGQETKIPGGFLDRVDAIITHEPIDSNGRWVEFIPVAVWEGLVLSEGRVPMIGTAGFPFKWKRPDVVVDTAIQLGVMCRLIAPAYPVPEAQWAVADVPALIARLGSLSDVRTDWMSVEFVIRLLAQCTVNIFWFDSQSVADEFGQSGSVRLGISACRPTIISRHRKFRTLMPYADEFYIADTVEQVVEFAEEILISPETARRPNRIVKEMGWTASGLKHRDLIERLLA